MDECESVADDVRLQCFGPRQTPRTQRFMLSSNADLAAHNVLQKKRTPLNFAPNLHKSSAVRRAIPWGYPGGRQKSSCLPGVRSENWDLKFRNFMVEFHVF